MAERVLVCCPNPACPGRIVEGQSVTRETWEATWLGPYVFTQQSSEWRSDISCPQCGTEGIDPEFGLLDSAEEELGHRCDCGIVSTVEQLAANGCKCPHCSREVMPA